jgi:hypothetical protein
MIDGHQARSDYRTYDLREFRPLGYLPYWYCGLAVN